MRATRNCRRRYAGRLLRGGLVGWLCFGTSWLAADAAAQSARVVEDFEGYALGAIPNRWRMPDQRKRRMVPIPPDHATPTDYVEVFPDSSGQVLRVYTHSESVQIGIPHTEGLQWDLTLYPRLSWRWKADQLPEGASEERRSANDTGAAVYVAFDCNDLLRRPCTLKYTYSSSLEVGTEVRYGRLWAIVASSALEPMHTWRTVIRDVAADYQRLFGADPPGNPIYIMIWGDSDNTGGVSDAYFDDLTLLPVH